MYKSLKLKLETFEIEYNRLIPLGTLLFLVLLNALLRFTSDLSYHTLPNMEKQATIHVILKIVCKSNRTKYSTYSRQNVPMFDSLNEMKEYLLENFAVELSPVDCPQLIMSSHSSSAILLEETDG